MKPLLIILVFLLTRCKDKQKEKEFAAFENAPVTITTEMIINDSIIDLDNVQAVIDPVWHTADIYQSKEKYEESLQVFTLNQRYVHAIQWYMSEVNNGGHYQFFTNSTGIVWKDALKGFQTTGLHDYYMNLKKAIDLFPDGPSFDYDTRNEQLEKINDDFSGFDARFYELDEKTALESHLIGFIKRNRKDFYFKGKVKQPFVPSSGN